ncbi:MAG: hypothetical protein AB7N76_25925 [Planctomycetota bacterium]
MSLRELELRRSALRAQLLRSPDDGEAHLELGVLEKLLGGEEGIVPAFAHLRRALALLPPEALAARQRALFVLGLTYGDVSRPACAVASFDEAAAADSGSTAAVAARGYAAAYRERFGVSATRGSATRASAT